MPFLKIECPVQRSKSSKTPVEYHYLVHFQGWSSTWDRYVTDEFLLKTTEDNRALQKKLFTDAEEASESMKKKKKKRPNETSISSASSTVTEESGPSKAKKPKLTLSPKSEEPPTKQKVLSIETKDASTSVSASVSPSSASALISKPQKKIRNRSMSHDVSEPDVSNSNNPVKLSEELKIILEQEFYRITKRKTLTSLPANPNVASVLEDYVKHYAAISLVNYEKQISKTFYTAARKDSAALFTKVLDNINIAKEIADSLRIMFDFNLKSVLLYGSHGEQKQYKEVMKPGNVVKRSRPTKDDSNDDDLVYLNPERRGSINEFASSRSSTTSGRTTPSHASLNPPAASPTSPQAIKVLRELQEWRLVPDSFYEDHDRVPMESLVYGPSHLLRLFVKMPEILGKMTIPMKTKKLVMKYLDSVLDYLKTHQDLFE